MDAVKVNKNAIRLLRMNKKRLTRQQYKTLRSLEGHAQDIKPKGGPTK